MINVILGIYWYLYLYLYLSKHMPRLTTHAYMHMHIWGYCTRRGLPNAMTAPHTYCYLHYKQWSRQYTATFDISTMQAKVYLKSTLGEVYHAKKSCQVTTHVNMSLCCCSRVELKLSSLPTHTCWEIPRKPWSRWCIANGHGHGMKKQRSLNLHWWIAVEVYNG